MEELLHQDVYSDNEIESKNIKLIPAKVISFIKKQNNEMNVIIHSCLDNAKKISVLSFQWELEFEEQPKKRSKKN